MVNRLNDNMKDKHIKFIDFIFNKLKSPYGITAMLDDLSYDFKEESHIEISHDETEFIKNKFFNDLFQPEGNTGFFKLSIKSLDIIYEYESYSKFLKSKNDELNRQKEFNDLNIELSRLQIENTKLNNRRLKRDLWFSIIGFVIASIVTNWQDILILIKILPQE